MSVAPDQLPPWLGRLPCSERTRSGHGDTPAIFFLTFSRLIWNPDTLHPDLRHFWKTLGAESAFQDSQRLKKGASGGPFHALGSILAPISCQVGFLTAQVSDFGRNVRSRV